MDVEEWRPVIGYEGVYEVSSFGRVASVRNGSRRIRKKCPHTAGYWQLVLSFNNKQRVVYTHRLVLEAFVGPCPAGMEACHNNGDRSDDRLSNLRWDTPSNNQLDKRKHNTMARPRGSINPQSKLCEAVVPEIRRRVSLGESASSIAKDFNVHPSIVRRVHRKKIWTHVT